MKIKYGLILAVTLSTGVTAQVASNVPPSLPAPDAPAITAEAPADAAKPAEKKKSHKLSADAKKRVERHVVRDEPPREPFATNDLAVAKAKSVNVRGQANINSDIVTQLKEGDTVTVLGEVKLVHPKDDEPSTWVRIALPPDTHVWVNSTFLDTNHLVMPRKLNVRSGPGENYSVVGLLYKGDEIKPVGSKDDWAEIAAPTNSYAFVAAHLLGKKEAPAPVVVPVAVVETPAATPTEPVATPPVITPPVVQADPVPAPTPAVVDNKATLAPPPVNPPAVETNAPVTPPVPTPTTVETNAPATPTNPATVTLPVPTPPAETNAPAPPKATEPTPAVPTPAVAVPVPVIPKPVAETPPPKRIVTREGIVGDMVSIQAPTHFRLESLETGKTMDYLFSTNSSIIIKKYLGKTVLVTGEEGLDERWENTPVLTVQKIQPVE